MAYTIYKTNGTILATIPDGTTNTANSSLTIVGRGVVNYGEYVAENDIRLLENFANSTAPFNPLEGQLWYNTSNGVISVFDGTDWVSPVSEDYYSSVVNTTGTATITVNNDNGITVGSTAKLKLGYSSGALQLTAYTSDPNVVPAMTIDPVTKLVTVAAAPTSELGVATKEYVDTRTRIGPNTSNYAEVQANSFALVLNGNQVITTTSSELEFAGFPKAQTPVNTTNDRTLATTEFVQRQKESPLLTGIPRAPTAAPGTNTTQLATTQFVTTSPIFVGVPAAPTAERLTNTTQLATTAFVQLNKESPAFTGVPTAPTATVNTSTTQISTTEFVQNQLFAYSDSPVFRGVPAAPTADRLTNTTQLATTAFVQSNKESPAFTGVPTAPTAAPATNTTQLATTEFVQNQKVSPVFTGVPRAPTAPPGTRTNQIATTEYVQSVKDELSEAISGAPIVLSLDTRGLDLTGTGPASVVAVLNTLVPTSTLRAGTLCRVASTIQNVTTAASVSTSSFISIRYVTGVSVTTTVANPTRNNNLTYRVNSIRTSWEYVSG